jgi:hypothetical protein
MRHPESICIQRQTTQSPADGMSACSGTDHNVLLLIVHWVLPSHLHIWKIYFSPEMCLESVHTTQDIRWYLRFWPVINLALISDGPILYVRWQAQGSWYGSSTNPQHPQCKCHLLLGILFKISPAKTQQTMNTFSCKRVFRDKWSWGRMQITRTCSLILSPVYRIPFLYNTTDA